MHDSRDCRPLCPAHRDKQPRAVSNHIVYKEALLVLRPLPRASAQHL